MQNVCVLIAEEPNQVLDKEHQTKLPGIVGWNVIQLSCNMFIQKYRTIGFDSFKCPERVDPLLFSQLCVFHFSDVQKNQTLGTTSRVMSQQITHIKSPKTDDLSKKKTKRILRENGAIGQVNIGLKKNPVCVPSNSVITVPG